MLILHHLLAYHAAADQAGARRPDDHGLYGLLERLHGPADLYRFAREADARVRAAAIPDRARQRACAANGSLYYDDRTGTGTVLLHAKVLYPGHYADGHQGLRGREGERPAACSLILA